MSHEQHIIHPGAGTKIPFLDTLAWIQFLISHIILSAKKIKYIQHRIIFFVFSSFIIDIFFYINIISQL